MNFKELMEEDLKNSFFNQDEFAEKIKVDNVEVIAIKHETTVSVNTEYEDTVFTVLTGIEMPENEYKKLPYDYKTGFEIDISEEKFEVIQVVKQLGSTKIDVRSYRS